MTVFSSNSLGFIKVPHKGFYTESQTAFNLYSSFNNPHEFLKWTLLLADGTKLPRNTDRILSIGNDVSL